jgi:hypothetical protein
MNNTISIKQNLKHLLFWMSKSYYPILGPLFFENFNFTMRIYPTVMVSEGEQ